MDNFNKETLTLEPDFRIAKQSSADNKICIVDQRIDSSAGKAELTLKSPLITDDSYKLILRGNQLILVISELIQITNFTPSHYYKRQFHSKGAYERLRSIRIMLPGNNFYILRHYTIPENNSLKIILGRIRHN